MCGMFKDALATCSVASSHTLKKILHTFSVVSGVNVGI